MITYKLEQNIDREQVMALYDSVGWIAYTQEPERLSLAIEQSLTVISAWQGNQLIGLIRAVGDGQTILYIQDLLVMPEFQNQKIGTALMNQLLAMYPDVRQKVLLTNDAPDVRHFYEKAGFVSCDSGDTVAFFRAY
ncbi:GNAT family acetyltransferase [Enterococcus sp. JM4C]|uniref:GNAT family N-acetyltransferase n=1 Tax=Candidatus Enterococcus huntleyi TaxID=1857217 RepID=UPI00137B5189|nr:GNAT family N-acetyltransferase [Enterococcus sp. JM4C]KAF1299311.1 GNAT family acetyltransferase [Enterococcus sp. JM4C]